MNVYVAVIIALLAGISAAVYAYGIKESVSTHRVLALLRFLWFGLLCYALVSRPVAVTSTTEVPEPLTLLIDTSNSLDVSISPILSRVEKSIRRKNIPTIVRAFNEESIPSNGPWMYLGDGHVAPLGKEVSTPSAAVFLPAKALVSLPLISSIAVPTKVQAGSSFQGTVHADQGARIWVKGMGQTSTTASFEFTAPRSTGIVTLTAIAELDQRKDTLEVEVEVVDHFSSWLVISAAPHPHEGMIRRYALRHGIAVRSTTFDQVKEPWSGPSVVIGGTPAMKQRMEIWCKGPVWFMSDATPLEATTRRTVQVSSFPTGHPPLSSKVRVAVKNAQLRLADRRIESRGIQWYASALESAKNQELFEELCASLAVWHTPNRIEVNVPQRLFQGQSYTCSAAAVGGNNVPLVADMEVTVRDANGAVVDRPTVEAASRGFSWDLGFSAPGRYSLEIVASIGGTSLTTSRSFEVASLDVESVRGFNTRLWARAEEAGMTAFYAEEQWDPSKVDWTYRTVESVKKNPQHNKWWYWGLVLICAASEWLLRRRQGMV